jgi:3-deoxy-D-manno-octulosonic-acid transferase
MGLLLDAIYASGLVATSPFWLYRMIRHGRYRDDIGQRFGAAPVRYGLQPTIWVHGVSLGEVNAAATLVRELHSQLPDYRVVVSSSTETGMAAAKRLFAPDHVVFRWPLDFSAAVGRALDRVKPSLVVLMEGEVWPNFLAACNRRTIPAVVVNGRLGSGKGYPGYKRLGPLAARLFNRLTAIGVQDDIYAHRYISLGVHRDKVHVTGMMKFDTAQIAQSVAGQDALASAMSISPGEELIVAGGTGPGEEKMLLDRWREFAARHPQARLAIVPRKPERFDEVASLIAAAGFTVIRRSRRPDGGTGASCGTGVPPVSSSVRPVLVHNEETHGQALGAPDGDAHATIILGDTMGELRKFYSLARCVFIGRSLVPMGGSDMIESAALGKPTAFGPHTFNFPQADALAQNGCARVADAQGLMRQLDAWLADAASANAAGQKAQSYVRSQQGATLRNVEMICQVLGRVPAVAPGAIATDRILSQKG